MARPLFLRFVAILRVLSVDSLRLQIPRYARDDNKGASLVFGHSPR